MLRLFVPLLDSLPRGATKIRARNPLWQSQGLLSFLSRVDNGRPETYIQRQRRAVLCNKLAGLLKARPIIQPEGDNY